MVDGENGCSGETVSGTSEDVSFPERAVCQMDQIFKALGVINSFHLEGLSGSANPASGARLNLDAKLSNLRLTAADGADPGIAISIDGFGAHRLSLPTPQDPSLSVDPYARSLRVDLDDRFFARAATFLNEPVVAEMHHAINRVEMDRVNLLIRLTGSKVAHIDVDLDKLTLQHDEEELIRVLDLSLSVLDFDTKKPPAVAQKEAIVVLRKMRLEVEQRFFERILSAVRKKIPPVLEKLDIELPGPVMVVDARARVKVPISFRVDLRLETENDLFGIYFDRFYLPGTNMKLPGFTRNILLGLFRTFAEDKLKGLVETSNESMRINPWGKIPLDLRKSVKTFAVENQRIVLKFGEPSGDVPAGADSRAKGAQSDSMGEAVSSLLAPGPSV